MLRTIGYVILLLVNLGISPLSIADSSNQLRLNQTMTKIGTTMIDLFPLIVAKRELTTTEIERIQQNLDVLLALFQQASPDIEKKSDTYLVTLQYAIDYLRQTNMLLAQDVDEGRKQLYSLAPICTSCHTQDDKLRTLFSGTDRKQFADDYSYAEFNYLSRNYSTAISYYEKFLQSPSPKTELDIIESLQRIITIYIQIFNKPAIAKALLTNYLSLNQHTPETKQQLKGWIAGTENLQKSGIANDLTEFQQIQNKVTQILGTSDQAFSELNLTPQQEIERVWLRGQLYHYLNHSAKTSEVPMILYWLSICDRTTGYNFYFSLADLFLQECILNHTNHPYAKHCFTEYENFLVYRYSGSSGTHIPENEQNTLRIMRKKLGSH